jgi:hypothetical protein
MPTDAHAAGSAGSDRRAGTGFSSGVAAVLILFQAVLLGVAAIILAASGLRPAAADEPAAEVLAAIGLASAVAVGFLARGVALRRRWARSPILVLELICLPIAVTVVRDGRWYAGVPLAVSALAVLALLALSGQLAQQDGRAGG